MPQATTPAAAAPDILSSLFPLIVLLGIFYLLIILPQQRQAKKHKEMTNALKNGDKVVTSGGVLGEVVKADENDEFIKVEINKGVTIRIERSAIARKVDEDKAAASGGFFAAETK